MTEESWTATRALIARTKKKNPDADVRDLQAKLREQVAVKKILEATNNLTYEQRCRIAKMLLEM